MKKLFIIILLVANTSAALSGKTVFKPTVESLRQYKCPEWFRDAKFGIYLHWGVYSVVEQGEWYARNMYKYKSKQYKHHVKTYGHPSKFGYKDFIPMWKAEKFDPDALVKLFKEAGAKYFTPVAVHHDNFDLWNSKHHKWNSVNMGPKKDITGMWRKATLKHGLRWGVTTHLARSYSWFNVNKDSDKRGKYKGIPYDGNDPEYKDYYHEKHDDMDGAYPVNASEFWKKQYLLRLFDLIDQYKPDLLYFDGALPFGGKDRVGTGKVGMKVLAHLYNESIKNHNGRMEAVMTIKDRVHKKNGIYHEGIATLDLERAKLDHLRNEPWQTDDSIGPWGYDVNKSYFTVNYVIDKYVDIVSKNGNLLLNVPPKADGTLDDETIRMLKEIGKWNKVNGEAIYKTRPWVIFGEGPEIIDKTEKK